MRRAALLLLPALLLALPGQAADKRQRPRKEKAPAGPALPGEKVSFKTSDGWDLTGKFQPSLTGQLTFILLHGVGSRKEEFGTLGDRLASRGYGVLAYDARGHGESVLYSGPGYEEPEDPAKPAVQPPPVPGEPRKVGYRRFRSTGSDNEWNRMDLDVQAALDFLAAQGVQPSSVAFAGASIGANVLLNAAVARPEIRLTVLLSPGASYRDVLTVNPIRKYGKRPLLIVAAADDAYALQSSQLLYRFAQMMGGSDKIVFMEAPKGHGVNMLTPAVLDAVTGWVDAESAGLPPPLTSLPTAPVQLPASPATAP